MNEQNPEYNWLEFYPSPVTVCDTQAIIVAMNSASRKHFARRGGGALIGTSLFDCHPEPANSKIRKLLCSRQAEIYIVEHKGRKRLIHQAPWYKHEEFAGLMETIIELDGDIEQRKRS